MSVVDVSMLFDVQQWMFAVVEKQENETVDEKDRARDCKF